MRPRAQELDHADLLESMTWCRELARRLSKDVHGGEDAAQEAWVAALRSGSPGRLVGARLRGWLGRAASNRIREVRRSDSSRRRREERTARPEIQESVLEVLERGEMQRRILGAVLALPEPYASTVLQRYFEERSCAQIARREGVSGDVVRKRLSRALAMLRGKLEREFRGERDFLAALALIAGPERPWLHPFDSVRSSPLAVRWGLGTVFCGALCAVAAIGLLAERRPGDAPPSYEPLLADGVHGADERLANQHTPLHALSRRTPVVEPSSQVAPTVAGRSASEHVLRGRVLDSRGAVVAGVGVRGLLATAAAAGAAPETRTSGDGRFQLLASPALERIVVRERGLATVLAGTGRRVSEQEVVLVVAPAIELAGRVVDAEGRALAGARVSLVVPEAVGANFDVVLDHSVRLTFATRADERGAFDLGEVPWVEGVSLRVEREGLAAVDLAVPCASNRALVLMLEPRNITTAFIDGVVLGPDGRAVEDALVSIGFHTTRSGADGAFRVACSPASRTLGPARVSAMKRGYRSASLDLGAHGAQESVVLRLPGNTRSIEGRVVDELGVGIAGAKVWLADPTLFGALGARPAFVEALQVSDEPPLWSWVRSDAGGRFDIDGLDERTYRVAALDVVTLVRGESSAVPGEEAVVVVPRSRVARAVTGRVEDVFGAPVVGAAVTLYRRTRHVRVGEAHEWVDEESFAPVVTGEDGLFRLPIVPLDGARVRVDGEGCVPAHFLFDATSSLVLRTFVVQPRTHLRVELTASGAGIDEARLVDAEGEPVDVGILRGPEVDLARSAAFFDTRTHLLVVPRSAAVLVLYSEGLEVHRAPLAVQHGELNLVRY